MNDIINLDSDILNIAKDKVNEAITMLLHDMLEKNAAEGSITLKLDFTLEDTDDAILGKSKNPSIDYKITKKIVSQEEVKGSFVGPHVMYENEDGEFAVRPVQDDQVNIFDNRTY